MKNYNLNLIFVEGEIDKVFIDFVLLKHFQIVDHDLVVVVNGKDRLSKQIELKNVIRKTSNAKNLLIFDTDFKEKGGGRVQRLAEYQAVAKEVGVEFQIFLLPFNDKTEGEVEDLIKTCFNKNFDFFDNCWNEMLKCFEKHTVEKPLNVPAKEGFLFSKIDLFKNYRQNQSWNYNRLTRYDFSDEGIWNLDFKTNPKLENLVNFIKENLFDE
jgi:hypothetical protein